MAKKLFDKEKMSEESLDLIAKRFKALSEPMRLKIIQTIWHSEMSVQDIVAKVQTSQVNVSKHLAVLHECGFLKRRKEGLYTFYSIADTSVFTLCDMMCSVVKDKLNDQIRSFS